MVSLEQRQRFAKDVEKDPRVNASFFLWEGEEFFARGCYGEIEEDCEEDRCGIISLVVFHSRTEQFDEELFNLIMSDEMFGPCFVSTDLEVGLTDGWEMDLSLPYQYVLGAMISLRYCFNIEKTSVYRYCKSAGASTEVSLILDHGFLASPAKLYLRSYLSDHHIFGYSFSPSSWLESKSPEISETQSSLVRGYNYSEDMGDGYDFWEVWPKQSKYFLNKAALIFKSLAKENSSSLFNQDYTTPNSKENINLLIQAVEKGELG